MAYSDYYDSYDPRARHDSYYSRHNANIPADAPPAMRYSVNQPPPSSYSSSSYRQSYDTRYYTSDNTTSLPSRPAPYKSSAYTSGRSSNQWPPRPSVEDESVSLAKEFPSSAGSTDEDDSAEARSRGTVDQYPIIEELEQPHSLYDDNNERRFVLVKDTDAQDHSPGHAARNGRRKSFAERGNMPHINTDVNDPPVFTERTSTPYAYTKPQKESLAPTPGEYFTSPDAVTPSSSSQKARPDRRAPAPSRQGSYKQSPTTGTSRNDVFEDSDGDSDSLQIRTEPRRSGRYSFVKSDLQKEDLRTNVLESQARSERRKHRDRAPSFSANRESHGTGSTSSSGSSKHPTPSNESPRSSTSSLGRDAPKTRPPPVERGYSRSSRYTDTYSSRPSSPYGERPSSPRSPGLPPRPASPSTARPSSLNGGRPPSPLSSSNAAPRSHTQAPITGSDWHATYPPVTERSRPPARFERNETMPAPMPHIHVKSPSPVRVPKAPSGGPLPYPIDDRLADAFMPPEENYQYDHSTGMTATPTNSTAKQSYPEASTPGSPRLAAYRPSPTSRHSSNFEDASRSPQVRPDSVRSQSSHEPRRERRTTTARNTDRPLPACPRREPSTKYNDWYSMEDCSNFDICPSCYENVFADTPFAVYFSQPRRYERPKERFCDFSSSWVRLAWHLTWQQRRPTLELLYALARIAETERECPGDRALTTDHIPWYGLPDQRDGIHIANFAICPQDLKQIEVLFPTFTGYFTRLPPSSNPYGPQMTHTCSLRMNSRRFPKYLDLLMELDAEAQNTGQRPNINRFVQLARENAFKNECSRDKPLFRKPWHYIPQLPEFTVCQECYDDIVLPALVSSPSSSTANTTIQNPTLTSFSTPYSYPTVPAPVSSTLPALLTRTIQPLPSTSEDAEIGSSCYLYSPRMRSIWARAVADNDFGYLKRKVLERKKAEAQLGRERRGLMEWLDGCSRGSREWERGMEEWRELDREWREWE